MSQGQVLPPSHGLLERVPDDPLHAEAGVERFLDGYLGGSALAEYAARSHIRPLRVLPEDEHVATVGCQVRDRGGYSGQQLDGPEVHVELEVESQPEEQPSFQDSGRDVRRADRSYQDGVEAGELLFHRVGQDLAGGEIPVPSQVVALGLDGEPAPVAGCFHGLEGLNDNLGSDSISGDDRQPVPSFAHQPVILTVHHKVLVVF